MGQKTKSESDKCLKTHGKGVLTMPCQLSRNISDTHRKRMLQLEMCSASATGFGCPGKLGTLNNRFGSHGADGSDGVQSLRVNITEQNTLWTSKL